MNKFCIELVKNSKMNMAQSTMSIKKAIGLQSRGVVVRNYFCLLSNLNFINYV